VTDGEPRPANGSIDDKSLGDLVNRVTENASTLIREEIELAQAEIELKVKRLAQGAVVGVGAGFFVLLALVFGFNALAWGLSDVFNNGFGWLGFLITTGILLLFAGLAGLIAMRAFKAGAPPTPDMAIEEAKRIRATLEHPEIEAGAAQTTPKI
jgi:Putative Actinobacterial Holin-X, holin superfamily III